MQPNSLLSLIVGWGAGLIIGSQLFPGATQSPTLLAVIGFVFLGGLTGLLFFGKTASLFLVFLGMIQFPLLHYSPTAGVLLGLCTIGASLFGKTLGYLALEDFYEDGKTRLPGLTLAALLHFILILLFAILVWYLFGVLPTGEQLYHLLPLGALGV